MRRLFSFLLAVIAMFALRLPAAALTVQEAVHRAKPAVVLISVRVEAEVTMNCGQAPVIVTSAWIPCSSSSRPTFRGNELRLSGILYFQK